MKLDNAVIIGYGVVGKATAKALGIGHYFDLKDSNISIEDASKKDYIFICLPTPTINGRSFTKDIEKTVKKISHGSGKNTVIVIRSTTTPGTTKKLSQKYKIPIIHHPEFLTQSSALEDTKNPDILVFGCDDRKVMNKFTRIYKNFSCSKYKMDSISSEILKYAINTFYATKVVFANQIYDLCQKYNVDYDLLKNAMYSRKWVGRNHLDVWHKGYRGAGGNCLPKDLEAFVTFSKLPLLKQVLEINTYLLSKPNQRLVDKRVKGSQK